tara:strand:+ start:386 stop:508 length:123 start_codon:yes stop_codon:yes gene_type:complete
MVLNRQGKYAEALDIYKKALDIELTVFGSEHLETARVYNK